MSGPNAFGGAQPIHRYVTAGSKAVGGDHPEYPALMSAALQYLSRDQPNWRSAAYTYLSVSELIFLKVHKGPPVR